MVDDLRFGVVVVQNLPWPRWRERVLEVEGLGYDAVYVWDHLVHRTQQRSDPLFDGLTALAAAAGFTRRIRLGTMVAAPIHRHPLVLANQAMTIDRISGGRLELGLGAGGSKLDHAALGIDPWDPPELVARFRETVELYLAVMHGESSYHGAYYHGDEMTVAPGPIQQPHPPLTLAAHGARTIEVAARHAGTWNAITPQELGRDEALAWLADRSRVLDRAAGEAGRDPASIRRSVLVGSERWPALSSVDAFRDAVQRYREIGFTDIVFLHPDHPAEAGVGHGPAAAGIVRDIAERVLPASS